MKRKISTLWIIAFIACALFAFSNTASAEDIVIIINNNVPDKAIKKEDVQKIYSGHKTKWSNNDSILLTVLPKSELHEKFLKSYVRKSPSQFKMTWKKMVFTGKGKTPQNFETIEELIDYVAKNDGAIGYVTTDSSADNVKVIKVD